MSATNYSQKKGKQYRLMANPGNTAENIHRKKEELANLEIFKGDSSLSGQVFG